MRGFYCRIGFNPDVAKIRKFFDETETLYAIFCRDYISFMALTPGNQCYYMTTIHRSDIYRFEINTTLKEWSRGGIVKQMQAAPLTTLLKNKGVNRMITMEVDEEGQVLTISVGSVDGSIIKSVDIALLEVETLPNPPLLTYANAILGVSEFKKLYGDVSKENKHIVIEYQKDGIKFHSNGSILTYGKWNESLKPEMVLVPSEVFKKASKINIGHTKNSDAGLYIDDINPFMIKTKLGIVDFVIYSIKMSAI